MTSTGSTVRSRQREQWVDTLRVVLISGVIVVHTATAYVTDFTGYYYDDERVTNTAASIAVALPALMAASSVWARCSWWRGGSRSGRWRGAVAVFVAPLILTAYADMRAQREATNGLMIAHELGLVASRPTP